MKVLQGEPTELPAYPNYAIPDEIRARACTVFAAGTYGCGHLAVKEEQRFYGKSAAEIRNILDHDGSNTGDFVLIDKDMEQCATVTYVGGWHDPSQDGLEVVQTNYNVGNSSLAEDISMVFRGTPYNPDADYTPLDINEDESVNSSEVVYVLAAPGEWEEGPGNLLDIDPPQDRVYRLKSHVAEAGNLSNPWAVGWVPVPEDGAPDGSMCFAQERLTRRLR